MSFLVKIFLLPFLFSTVIAVGKLPSLIDRSQCGHTRTDTKKSFLCDPEGFLSQNAFGVIDAQLGTVKAVEVVVVVLDSMSRAFVGIDSIAVACERFASQLADGWGVGDPLLENGVLLLVSIGDRCANLVQGRGVSSDLLSDHAINLITFRVKASLRSKEYDRIFSDSILQLTSVLNGERFKFEDESNRKHADEQNSVEV